MDNINFDEHSLAYELLVELKHSAKRWFVAFCVMVFLELITIAGFIWYISLPSEEYYIEQEAGDRSFNNVSGGNVTNGSEAESELQKADDEK